ncbi:MAG: calcium-binding protein, partial [Cyanobacteriota bacterium]|nr:calcium-binding protein [Cyanobacteriota bacterium]
SGNDTLIGGSGKDLIIGDQDAFGGQDGDDEINAGSEDDTVYGGGGSDTILGGSGNDLIDGGDSRDITLADRDSDGNDELFGGEGNDIIRGGLGSDTLDGGGTRAGEIDFLLGSGVIDGQGGFLDATSDLFILGNETAFLYGAGAGDVIGTNIFGQGDRAIIQLFENGIDKIQVPNPDQVATVVIGNSRFILIPRNGGFEIIAELQNFTDVLAPDTFVTPPIDNSGDNDFQGTENNDLLDGGEGNDTLTGLDGDDILDGGVGNDSLDGGNGIDTVRYENDAAAVQVNLSTQTATDGFGDNDTLLNIENVVGSAFADSIIGDAQDNNLSGGAGDDTLEGGVGNDILDGGDGIDTVSYQNDSAGINLNLTNQTVADGSGGTDTVLNIENAVGSQFADIIIGDAQDNNLNGGAGNDILLGAAGADFMVGTSSATGGTGEIDRLIGSADGVRDVFSVVEAGTNNVFYLGGGGSDFAQIENFELGVDRIGINNNLLGNIFLGNSGGNAVLGFTGNGGVDVVALVVGIDAATLSQQSFLTLV